MKLKKKIRFMFASFFSSDWLMKKEEKNGKIEKPKRNTFLSFA
jgi:hypothetical protein